MDLIASPFGVLLILGLVAVTAVVYQPSNFPGKWQKMFEWFTTNRQPPQITFRDERIYVGSYANCDVTPATDGLWIQPTTSSDEERTSLLIPWHCMRAGKKTESAVVFMLREELTEGRTQQNLKRIPQVDMTVSAELGEVIMRKMSTRSVGS